MLGNILLAMGYYSKFVQGREDRGILNDFLFQRLGPD